MMTSLLLLLAQALAFLPAIHWYALRTRYDSTERWELIALAAAFLYVAARARENREPGSLLLPALLTIVWAASSLLLPPLLSTWLAWTALAATASTLFLGRRFDTPLFGLATLSLPVLPLFQYHLSYPLRAVVAECSAASLRFLGLSVVREGACLAFGERLVWVDAPCSGVRMMWSALLLTTCLAAMHRLGPRRLLPLLLITLVVVVAANVLRTTTLFLVEAGILSAPGWFHQGAGVAVHAAAAALLLLITIRIGKEKPCVAAASS